MTTQSAADEPPVGAYRPPRIAVLHTSGPEPARLERLRTVTSLSSAFSDELDRAGFRMAVPATTLDPLRGTDVVVGRALTLRYVPMRMTTGPSRLAHLTACRDARRGDVLVIQGPRSASYSVLGGLAATACLRAGLAGIVVDGAVRDLDEIDASGLAVWARTRTPMTGRGRLDAVEINGPIEIGDVGVLPGDIVIADRSGVVFVPADLFEALADRILQG